MGSKTVWVVGKWMGNGAWQMDGIFSTEEDALAVCSGENQFFAPIDIGTDYSQADTEWPGLRYPNVDTGKVRE